MRRLVLLVVAGLWVGGCLGGEDPGTTIGPETERSLAALLPVDDCGDLLEQLQSQAIASMEEQLANNLEMAIEYGAYGWCWDYAMEDGYPTAGGGPPAPNERGDSASEYSETNTQVRGVDEADFVKNDGAYIYILADNRFQVIDAWPPEDSHIVSTFEIEGIPRKMFVHSDRALIYSSLDPLPQPNTDPYYYYYGSYYGEDYDECTYGYNCDFTGDGRALKVTVLDISDLTAPALLREIEFTGSLVNARRIDDAVFSVVSFPQSALTGIMTWPEPLTTCSGVQFSEEEIRELFSDLELANRRIILSSTITDWLPSVVDTRYVGGEAVVDEGLLQSCDGFYVSQQQDGQSYLSLMSLDMIVPGAIDATTVVGRPGAVYASPYALYVASRHQQMYGDPWFYEDGGPEEASTVHKFDLITDPPSAYYAGSGVVKGRVLNQFAMDELDGFLRIATTTGHVPSPDVHSTITVLEEQSGELNAVGVIDNIAPTEDIRAVRFDGDRGFIVTFKKTDPLFAIDMADPFNPHIAGELHIPGYSTYMHWLDKEHLLTIGYDADDQGDFAWFQGILLQVFDVGDMTNPTLEHREVIGTRGSTTEAATNHLAFNYFAAREMLALPMVVCEESAGGGSYGQMMTFGGLMVYHITPEDGFTYQGGIPHVDPESEYSEYSSCNNWWTDSNSYVQRSIFMDDYAFSVAVNSIEVAHLDSLETVLAEIDLISAP